jgi:hypothetical protein
VADKKQQSPNWEKYADKAEEFYKSKQKIPGFPFTEKFPRIYSGQEYQLILLTGEKCKALVDDSREFMSEGLEWKLLTYTDNYNAGANVERYNIAAWKEI